MSQLTCRLIVMDLDSHLWVYDYSHISQKLKAAKYKQEFHYYKKLGKELAYIVSENIDLKNIDFVTSVPTSKKHIRERGFDHGKYLGKITSRKLCIQYKSLLEQAYDFVQVNSSLSLRHRQARYICKTSVFNQNILLIDDVATTRTSLNMCAKVLKKSGAKSVIAATIAYQPRR